MAFRLTVTALDHGARIEVLGELDIASAPELEAELLRRLADPACREVVLDLRPVTFIDSSGLRSLLVAEREAAATGRRLRVIPGTGQVLRVIELADVADRLNLDRG
jgi:anti-anti-sigma factor